MRHQLLTAVVFVLLFALSSPAQQSVNLQFQDGRVTLRAQNAPIRTILAEWARLGGATIVNGDRIAGPPVTLELTGVPERQALDVVLRSVAGYMLAPRRAGKEGASAFDRILILPTSAAPRTTAAPPSAAVRGGVPRPTVTPPRPGVVPRPPSATVAEVPADIDPVEEEPADAESPFAPSVTPVEPRMVPQPLTRPPVAAGVELGPDQLEPDGTMPPAAAPGSVTPTPTNPFGIPFGSSATPGVVTPVPQQQQRPAPANRVQYRLASFPLLASRFLVRVHVRRRART